MSLDADVLIVGSGAAGLTAALNLAETRKVAVIAKGSLSEGATSWAQGGIAAVLEEGDSFEAHVNDTMIAGAGLNDLQCRRACRRVRPARDPASDRPRRAVRDRGRSAPPDPRRRAQPPPNRPCRGRHRLCRPAGARSGGGKASEHHAGSGHGRDRPRHRPQRDPFLDQRRGARALCLQPQEEAGRRR